MAGSVELGPKLRVLGKCKKRNVNDEGRKVV